MVVCLEPDGVQGLSAHGLGSTARDCQSPSPWLLAECGWTRHTRREACRAWGEERCCLPTALGSISARGCITSVSGASRIGPGWSKFPSGDPCTPGRSLFPMNLLHQRGLWALHLSLSITWKSAPCVNASGLDPHVLSAS